MEPMKIMPPISKLVLRTEHACEARRPRKDVEPAWLCASVAAISAGQDWTAYPERK